MQKGENLPGCKSRNGKWEERVKRRGSEKNRREAVTIRETSTHNRGKKKFISANVSLRGGGKGGTCQVRRPRTKTPRRGRGTRD